MLEPHQMFAGRYRIVRHLADGGMGAVFEAEHVGTEARVALKLLWPHVVQVAAARKRFELEAKVAARVNSEHIVKVLDAGVDPESRSPYLVMELLTGATLAARVSQQGPLLPSTAVALMRQVARGLDAAHGYTSPEGTPQPIVHRDLKPENLFLTHPTDGSLHDHAPPAARVKILDFGIAKVLSEATSVSQEVRGTPLYMSFEQVAGEALSPQTDIWALGLITYFVLTGRRYWPAANKPAAGMPALFAEILSLPLPPPSQRIREDGLDLRLPPAFDTWLLRCINRTPARRFASAGQAIDALEHALAGDGAASSLPPRREPQAVSRFAVQRLSSTASYDAAVFVAASSEAAPSPSLPAVTAEHTRAPHGRRRQALAFVAAAGVGVLAAALMVASRRSTSEREITTVVTAQAPAPNLPHPRDDSPERKPIQPLEPPRSTADESATQLDSPPGPSEPRQVVENSPARVPPESTPGPPPQREPARAKVLPDKTPRPKEPKERDTRCESFDPYTGRCVRSEPGTR